MIKTLFITTVDHKTVLEESYAIKKEESAFLEGIRRNFAIQAEIDLAKRAIEKFRECDGEACFIIKFEEQTVHDDRLLMDTITKRLSISRVISVNPVT